jgi:hypothetical protein
MRRNLERAALDREADDDNQDISFNPEPEAAAVSREAITRQNSRRLRLRVKRLTCV